MQQKNYSFRTKIILEHSHTNLNKNIYCPEEITQQSFQAFHPRSSFIWFWQSKPIVNTNFTDYCKKSRPLSATCVVIGSRPCAAGSALIKKEMTNKTRRFLLSAESGSVLGRRCHVFSLSEERDVWLQHGFCPTMYKHAESVLNCQNRMKLEHRKKTWRAGGLIVLRNEL